MTCRDMSLDIEVVTVHLLCISMTFRTNITIFLQKEYDYGDISWRFTNCRLSNIESLPVDSL